MGWREGDGWIDRQERQLATYYPILHIFLMSAEYGMAWLVMASRDFECECKCIETCRLIACNAGTM